jgi:hypothetical protein
MFDSNDTRERSSRDIARAGMSQLEGSDEQGALRGSPGYDRRCLSAWFRGSRQEIGKLPPCGEDAGNAV